MSPLSHRPSNPAYYIEDCNTLAKQSGILKPTLRIRLVGYIFHVCLSVVYVHTIS
jgi:hypothetical protein